VVGEGDRGAGEPVRVEGPRTVLEEGRTELGRKKGLKKKKKREKKRKDLAGVTQTNAEITSSTK